MCEIQTWMTVSDLVERWRLGGDSEDRWRRVLMHWREHEQRLLKQWRDYRLDVETLRRGRYPLKYRTKRVIYLVLTQHDSVSTEVKERYLKELIACHQYLVSQEAKEADENCEKSAELPGC